MAVRHASFNTHSLFYIVFPLPAPTAIACVMFWQTLPIFTRPWQYRARTNATSFRFNFEQVWNRTDNTASNNFLISSANEGR